MADLLVDGNYLLHRAMRASSDVLSLYTSSGKPSGGAFSFLRSLRSILLSFKEVNRVITVFDRGKSARRKKLYPEYKQGKKFDNDPDENGWTYLDKFFAQVRILRFILPKMGIRIVEVKGKEADDLMYTIPRILTPQLTIIATEDKDLYQLVSEKVCIWRPIAQDLVTIGTFSDIVKCPLSSYILMKSIVGDSSDNINGVKGVGKKTAVSFIEKCGDVGPYPFDAFFESLAGNNSLRAAAIIDNISTILRNCELIDLSKENFSDEELRLIKSMSTIPINLDIVAVRKSFEALEFFSLLENFNSWIVRFQLLT